ncbi:PEP-CTERM sorting domain-containing protein [Massilia eburnea]|uniref:PEP-CTERM sorting domain-containing protein n=1 Tax=Massilia eburnea TaxID=1776165 RepID=UPI003D6C0D6E
MKNSVLSRVLQGFAAAAAFVLASAVQAGPVNLVQNGGFELSTNGNGQLDFNTAVSGWTAPGGYNFVFASGTADTSGAMTWFGSQNDIPLTLWGANNGGANALAHSANGGNFIAADGAYGVVPIQQAINSLVIGTTYMLKFEWAAAQQWGFHGETSEKWSVSIDGNTFETATYNNQSHASSGWMQEAFTFTAKSGGSLLSFLAAGTPEGHPPFSLLDGVSLFAISSPDDGSPPADIPEPASLLVMLTGLGLLAVARRRRQP